MGEETTKSYVPRSEDVSELPSDGDVVVEGIQEQESSNES